MSGLTNLCKACPRSYPVKIRTWADTLAMAEVALLTRSRITRPRYRDCILTTPRTEPQGIEGPEGGGSGSQPGVTNRGVCSPMCVALLSRCRRGVCVALSKTKLPVKASSLKGMRLAMEPRQASCGTARTRSGFYMTFLKFGTGFLRLISMTFLKFGIRACDFLRTRFLRASLVAAGGRQSTGCGCGRGCCRP